jgi:hypothetical protein
MSDQGRFERGDGKTQSDAERPKRKREGKRPPSQQDRGDGAHGSGGAGRPGGRLVIGREVKNDAAAQGDRQPGEKPPGANFGCDPRAHARRYGEAELRPNTRPAPLCTADRPSSKAGGRAAAHTGQP